MFKDILLDLQQPRLYAPPGPLSRVAIRIAANHNSAAMPGMRCRIVIKPSNRLNCADDKRGMEDGKPGETR
jgi:hypothetical protein